MLSICLITVSGFLLFFDPRCSNENLDCKVDHFNSTDDWESCEKSHGASDETDLIFNLDLNWNNILLYYDMRVTLK